jgi:hypothetical protein
MLSEHESCLSPNCYNNQFLPHREFALLLYKKQPRLCIQCRTQHSRETSLSPRLHDVISYTLVEIFVLFAFSCAVPPFHVSFLFSCLLIVYLLISCSHSFLSSKPSSCLTSSSFHCCLFTLYPTFLTLLFLPTRINFFA